MGLIVGDNHNFSKTGVALEDKGDVEKIDLLSIRGHDFDKFKVFDFDDGVGVVEHEIDKFMRHFDAASTRDDGALREMAKENRMCIDKRDAITTMKGIRGIARTDMIKIIIEHSERLVDLE